MGRDTSQGKVVLVYPRLPEKLPTLSFPIGPLYVGSYLVSQGYPVSCLDANNFARELDFLEALAGEMLSARAVGFSVMTAQVPHALEISAYVKKIAPSVPVIWGGIHPSLFPEQTAACRHVDYIVRDEGEFTVAELLRALDGETGLSGVRGIVYRSGDEVSTTPPRGFMDLDELPPLKWALLEELSPGRKLALREIADLTGRGVYLQTGRGCPHRCTFCINSVLGNRYRDRRSELVMKDIEELVGQGVDRIWFTDEIFFANRKRVVEILDGIEQRGLKFKWFADIRSDYFRPGHVNLELMWQMKRSGCEMLGIGAESGSQRILDILKKDITVENTVNAARLLKEVGLKASFSFMTGLPGEGREDILATLRLIETITRIDNSFSFRILGPQVYRPYPGSELYASCLREGMKEPASVEEWAESPYIRSETIISPEAFPWIKHSSKFVNNVVFYGGLSGIRLRYRLATRIVRKLASLRCRRLVFIFPVEKLVFNLLMKTGAYQLLRIKSILSTRT